MTIKEIHRYVTKDNILYNLLFEDQNYDSFLDEILSRDDIDISPSEAREYLNAVIENPAFANFHFRKFSRVIPNNAFLQNDEDDDIFDKVTTKSGNTLYALNSGKKGIKRIGSSSYQRSNVSAVNLCDDSGTTVTTQIGSYAFAETPLQKVVWDKTTKLNIGEFAFAGCHKLFGNSKSSDGLGTLVIPSNSIVGRRAFEDCPGIQWVTIDGPATFGEAPFRKSGLTHVMIRQSFFENESMKANEYRELGSKIFLGADELFSIRTDATVASRNSNKSSWGNKLDAFMDGVHSNKAHSIISMRFGG